MKKYFLGLAALLMAVVTVAFANPFQATAGKQLDDVYYRFDGLPAEFEEESKWVEIAAGDRAGLNCGDPGNICWILYEDQANSVHPPELPQGFNPYSAEEFATKPIPQ